MDRIDLLTCFKLVFNRRCFFRKFIVCSFWFWAGIAQGQYRPFLSAPPQWRPTTTVERDINRDGWMDSLAYAYDGGSGFGGTELVLKDGRTKKSYELLLFGSKWAKCFFLACPNDFYKKGNTAFTRAVERSLLPKRRFYQAEGSLRWILDAIKMPKQVEMDSGYFYKVLLFKPYWYAGDLFMPTNYFLRLPAADSKILMPVLYDPDTPEWFNQHTKGWISYYPNIGILSPTDQQKKLRLLSNTEAVVLQSPTAHAWIFVDETLLTGGDPKWGRIGRTLFWNDLVLIEYFHQHTRGWYVVDYHKGICAQLNYFSQEEGVIHPKEIVFRENGEVTTYTLSDIQQQLRQVYQILSQN